MARVFIFEGTDGVGKTTLIKEVEMELEHLGKKTLVLHATDPERDTYKIIRNHLFDKNRYDLNVINLLIISIFKEITNYVNRVGNNYDYVLIDRWVFSTLIYSGNDEKARQLALQVVSSIDLLDFERVIHIHQELDIVKKRNNDKEKDNYEKDNEFQELIHKKYSELEEQCRVLLTPYTKIINDDLYSATQDILDVLGV